MHSPGVIPDGERIRVPTGYAEFPKDFLHLPRSWAERTYGNIQRWTKMEKGGHFGALEQPELLAGEIREFFRPYRLLARSRNFARVRFDGHVREGLSPEGRSGGGNFYHSRWYTKRRAGARINRPR